MEQKISQRGSKVGFMLNKPSKNYQRLKFFCQTGKISPILITLLALAVYVMPQRSFPGFIPKQPRNL